MKYENDANLIYWMGEPINAMTREAAIEALGTAIASMAYRNFKIETLEREIKELLKGIIDEGNHSRFVNSDYIASFC